MLAVDTNIVVRYLTGDHPQQTDLAKALIDKEDIFVSATVLLETEWVLRKLYGWTNAPLAKALRGFAGLPRMTVENPSRVLQALDLTENGMDFADALHLAQAMNCDAFVTFDRHLARAARRLTALEIREL
jgi:predicted nucleic-acid-binding protein